MQSEGNDSHIGILVCDYKLLEKNLFVCEHNLGEVKLIEILSDPSAVWMHSPLPTGRESSWVSTQMNLIFTRKHFITWVHPKGVIPKPDTTF